MTERAGDYQCETCGRWFDLGDGFLGNPDPTDTSCHAFINLRALCRDHAPEWAQEQPE